MGEQREENREKVIRRATFPSLSHPLQRGMQTRGVTHPNEGLFLARPAGFTRNRNSNVRR